MKILALEFSSPQRSVAVFNPDTDVTAEVLDTGIGHTMKPFALIESALKQAGLEREQIEAIVVGLGPGSYTGIRAAIALAQGWQLARNLKLCGISSVECLATQEAAERSAGKFNVAIDAQRGEIYLATYEVVAHNLRGISTLRIVSAEAIQLSEQAGGAWIGPEVTRWFSGGRIVFPRASTLAHMAVETGFGSGEKLEPIYLRETKFVKAPRPRIILPG